MTASSFLPRAAFVLALAASSSFTAAQTPVTLPGIVVSAPRFDELAAPLPFGVSVIGADQIRASGATTVNEALMRLLGVVGRQDFYGGGEYSLDLRGFGAAADTNQVVIVDGVRVSEADLGGTRVAGIPIESVERIEVLRGSGAVLYGEGATGGVIVITTRSGAGTERRSGGSVYAGAGSRGLRDLRASATLATGSFALDATAQRRDSDNHRDNFRSAADAASVAGQWSGERGRIGLRLARDDLDTGLPGALSAAQYAANPRQTTTPNDHASIRNSRASVFGETSAGGWQLAADVGTRRKELRSINTGFPFDYDTDADTLSLRARHEGKLAGVANILVVGTDHGRWSRDVLGAFGSSASQTSHAWYAKDDVTLAGGSRLSAGARTERIAKDASNAASGLSGRLNAWELGASTPLAPGLTLYGRVGRSFRLASVDEFSFAAPGRGLRPQTSRDTELGARWRYASGQAEVRGYRSALANEIGFDPNAPGPFGFPGSNVNFDPTRRQGLELDASHALTRTVALRVNAALREAKFRAGPYAGRAVPLVPRESLAVRADWAPAAAHRLGGGVNWVGEQHPDFANACRIPAYTTADLRYAYQWQRVELSLAVANLFDRRYYTQAFACAGGGATSIYPEPGRAVTAAARVTF
ncbi:TonB-dependent receptor [Ramlibacter sp.]|uniref:TonB-dependent receptor n=1 Tax=Ramlibacter sp. TaxID=1917967 RepID=UPI002B88B43F|nr:TonB-dependent receptor [Ramlibacter sp.]HWI80453.1 TonB-dependent receptor [Ramlibacter sp.]